MAKSGLRDLFLLIILKSNRKRNRCIQFFLYIKFPGEQAAAAGAQGNAFRAATETVFRLKIGRRLLFKAKIRQSKTAIFATSLPFYKYFTKVLHRPHCFYPRQRI